MFAPWAIRIYIYEPRCEKTDPRGIRPGPTQSGLCNHRNACSSSFTLKRTYFEPRLEEKKLLFAHTCKRKSEADQRLCLP